MSDVGEREKAFWDEHVPRLAYCVKEYEAGPDPNTAAMLDALEPLAGKRVLDFACGSGITACFLAARGARVVGIDISPASIEQARELAAHAGLDVDFVAGELTVDTFAPETFDAVAGHYALHHVDLTVIAPIMRELLVPGGRGAFVETMGLNPVLSLARRRLVGRAGVASYGSNDEKPLDRADLRVLEMNIGRVELVVGEMRFLRILDRNVLRYRHRRASRALAAIDDALLRLHLGSLSYHQVVVFTAPR
ncbi:MAG TPA: class I SAM-dependent methyltransferase [Solirubrobacteraceae bacterium]|nr:class I SAM-dependent methyltransferase [Solirubrobacteraceae bacterium]